MGLTPNANKEFTFSSVGNADFIQFVNASGIVSWIDSSGTGQGNLAGGGGGGSNLNYRTVTGTINSSNVNFTLPGTPPGILMVYLNGLLQNPGVDYTTTTNSITFSSAPVTGSTILAIY